MIIGLWIYEGQGEARSWARNGHTCSSDDELLSWTYCLCWL